MCVSMWQLSFSVEVEFGASDLSRASSPCGDPVVCELCPCLRNAPWRHLSTSCSVVVHLSSPSSQAWRCWNQATPPSWCTTWTVCTGNPGRSCSTRAPPAWASTSWVVKTARASLSPSSWRAARPTWAESWSAVTRSCRWVNVLGCVGKNSTMSPAVILSLFHGSNFKVRSNTKNLMLNHWQKWSQTRSAKCGDLAVGKIPSVSDCSALIIASVFPVY